MGRILLLDNNLSFVFVSSSDVNLGFDSILLMI